MMETYTHAGLTIRIEQDDDRHDSPRDWDNLGTMVCRHSRYQLGDKGADLPDKGERFLALPLFLYDHSSLSMSTIDTWPYNCPWDAGQVGVIYVTHEQLRREYGVKRITKTIREKALRVLRAEVEVYDQYLRGEVYGYIIEDEDGQTLDSCWGFYGWDEVKQQAEESAEYFVKKQVEVCAGAGI
jgi:hypothetical protein